jgi:hypothetical protein
MQVTELQVQQSLRALAAAEIDPTIAPIRPGHADLHPPTLLPEGLLEQLAGLPTIRDERLARARHRLEQGEQPTAEALAQRMVGRLVCDRLR